MNHLGGARLVSYVEGEPTRIPQGIPIDFTEIDVGRADTLIVFHSHPVSEADFSPADKMFFEYQKTLVRDHLDSKALRGLNDERHLMLYHAVCNLNGEFGWMGHAFWIRSGGKIPSPVDYLVINGDPKKHLFGKIF